MRDITLCFVYKYKSYYARLISIDGAGYALQNIGNRDNYENSTMDHDQIIFNNVGEFRDHYVPEQYYRNGHQLSNIVVLLNREVIGRYHSYRPLSDLYENVLAEYPLDPLEERLVTLRQMFHEDLIDLINEQDKKIKDLTN